MRNSVLNLYRRLMFLFFAALMIMGSICNAKTIEEIEAEAIKNKQDKAHAEADRAAAAKAKEEADRTAAAKAKEEADRAAETKAKEDADRAAEAKTKEDADRAAEAKEEAGRAAAVAKAKKEAEIAYDKRENAKPEDFLEALAEETAARIRVLTAGKDLKNETPDEKTQRLLLSLCISANNRAVAVYDALWKLQKIREEGRHCMNKDEYNAYSTDDFDKKFKVDISDLRKHLDGIGAFDPRSRLMEWRV